MSADLVTAWEARGTFVDLAGLRVFYVDTGPADGPTTILLHGFPTSSHDWRLALPHMGPRRLIMPDYAGFGLSAKPVDHAYSLFEQADLVEMLVAHLGLAEVDLVAHDIGTSVACELIARRARGLLGFAVRRLVMMNGSVYLDMAHITLSQKLLLSRVGPIFARVASRRVFERQMRRITAQPLPPEELGAMWALMCREDGRQRLPQLIGYIVERGRFRHRWIGAMRGLRDVPVGVLWGDRDPVAVLAIGERLAAETPSATFERLEGLGHYPQVEDPARSGAAIRAFLDG